MTDKHYLEAELEDRLLNDPTIWDFIRRSSLDGVWFWDLENPEHEWMSPEFWKTLGFDPATKPHLADAWQDLINPKDLELATINAERHIADPNVPYDQIVRYANAKGGTTWVRCRGLALRNEDGKAVRLFGAHTELTELVEDAQRRETDFKVTNSRLNAVLNAAQSGIIGLDKSGQIAFVNPSARHMLGGIQVPAPFAWPPDYVLLDTTDLHPLSGKENPLNRSLDGDTLMGEVFVIKRRNGSEPRYLRISSAQVDVDVDTDVGVVLILDDISEQERNRQQIERSSRLDALGQLTGGIAHDFNNMLATIEYAVQLANDSDDPKKKTEFLDTALESVQRGADLTRRLLAFAKSQPGLAKSWSVEDIIERFAPLIKPTIEEHISLTFSTETPGLHVYCDRSLLENALLNLVLNSRDAIKGAGMGDNISISVRALTDDAGLEEDQADADLMDKSKTSRFVEFAVTDNGPGMETEVQTRAIDPFFTTKEGASGTGLGLSMVYGFATQSNGQLRIYSEPGHGTTVRISLPRGDVDGGRERPVARTPVINGNGEHVLLVENEARLLRIVDELLQGLGYQVTTASSGQDALDQVANGLRFDVLLTDVVMPGKIGGFALAKELRDLIPDIPVLYMSGYTGFSEAEMGTVVAPLIQKPCPPDDLGHALYKILNEARK